MKIAIMGYSGAGKSTLCRTLAEKYQIPALHLDQVQFLPNWAVRPMEEKQKLVAGFLENHPAGWVIDGNYTKLSYERKIEEADALLLLLFNRWNCLYRCVRRYLRYHGKSRPDMTQGCNEKLDWAFVRWVLWEGRSKEATERFLQLQTRYAGKVVVLKNQRQLDKYLKSINN